MSAPCPTCGGYGHGDPPRGRSKRYPTCAACKGTGWAFEPKDLADAQIAVGVIMEEAMLYGPGPLYQSEVVALLTQARADQQAKGGSLRKHLLRRFRKTFPLPKGAPPRGLL